MVFSALTNCGGLKEGESKEYVATADEEFLIVNCKDLMIERYSSEDECLNSECTDSCLKIVCSQNSDGTWDKATINKVMDVTTWLSKRDTRRFEQGTLAIFQDLGPRHFMYKGTYYTDSSSYTYAKCDECDPACENAKAVIGKNCHENGLFL